MAGAAGIVTVMAAVTGMAAVAATTDMVAVAVTGTVAVAATGMAAAAVTGMAAVTAAMATTAATTAGTTTTTRRTEASPPSRRGGGARVQSVRRLSGFNPILVIPAGAPLRGEPGPSGLARRLGPGSEFILGRALSATRGLRSGRDDD